MRFQCSNCLGIVSIDDSDAGQPVACGFCERVVVVPASRFAPGAVISDFVIEREIGKGGVGTVYLAQQLSLARPVALKILHPRFSNDPEYVSDFVREARAAAQLNHPTIVQAYAVGEEDGIFFFAMEYVEGTTLKQVLTHSGRIVWDRALMIVREVNEALNFAWSNKKLVHRDIKPDNIILADSGTVKLADLGLARRAGDYLEEQGGEIMGTPQYISPEQLLHATLDNRSDLYSLGATFYHAVTGRFPYLGDTPVETVQKHLQEPLIPPRMAVGDIPEPVSRIIEIMMSKRPEHRYFDAAELARDLELVANGEMPQHPLSPDAQTPVEIPGPLPVPKAEPVSIEAAVPTELDLHPDQTEPVLVYPAAEAPMKTVTVGKKIVLKTSHGTVKKTVEMRLNTTPSAPVAVGNVMPLIGTGPEAGDAVLAIAADAGCGTVQIPKRKHGMSVKTMVVIFSVCAGIALIAVFILIVMGIREKQKTPEQRELEALRKAFPEGQVQSFIAIRRAVTENAKPSEVLAEVKRFEEQNPQKNDLLDKIKTLAAPLAENEIASLRREKYDVEKKSWVDRAKFLENQDRLAREEEAKQQRAAEEHLRKQQDDERRKHIKQQQLDELRQQQERLRWEAIEKCRQDDFASARTLLAGMANSREEEFRNWAKAMQHCTELAENAVTAVAGAKETLKGFRLSLPGRRGKWTVVNVGLRDITFETSEIDVKTGNQIKKAVTVTWLEMPSLQFLDLMEQAVKKSGDAAADVNLLGGAYLLARGDYLNLREARRRLSISPLKDVVTPLLAELDVIEPVILDKQFALEMEKLKFLVNKGDGQNAGRLAMILKMQFPEQYKKGEGEITKLLQGN